MAYTKAGHENGEEIHKVVLFRGPRTFPFSDLRAQRDWAVAKDSMLRTSESKGVSQTLPALELAWLQF